MRSKQVSVGDDFEVWEENWTSVLFFLDYAATQWNQALGMAGAAYFGLRYEGIESAMRLIEIPRRDRKQLLQDLCTMERAALPILNQQSGKP